MCADVAATVFAFLLLWHIAKHELENLLNQCTTTAYALSFRIITWKNLLISLLVHGLLWWSQQTWESSQGIVKRCASFPEIKQLTAWCCQRQLVCIDGDYNYDLEVLVDLCVNNKVLLWCDRMSVFYEIEWASFNPLMPGGNEKVTHT